MKKILVYTKKNKSRSRMMQGWLQYYLKNKANVISAGESNDYPDIFAQKAMSESVLDILKNKTDNIVSCLNEKFDFVFILDGTPAENISFEQTPNKLIEKNFPDPSLKKGTDMEKLIEYRTVCNNIEDFALTFAIQEFNIF